MIWLPIEYPSQNKYINQERIKLRGKRHGTMGSIMRKKLIDETYWLLKSGKNKPIKTPCKLRFTWYMKDRKKDVDNIAYAKKFILDAMVNANIIPNDTFRYIKGFIDDFKVIDNVHKEIGVMIERVEVDE